MKSSKKSIRKYHIVTKTIWQIFLYFFEIMLIAGGLTWISRIIYPIIDFLSCIERFFVFYGIYQLLVFIILNNMNDIRIDSYIALIATYEIALLYCESKDERIKQIIDKVISAELDNGVFNDLKIRLKYETIKKLVEMNDIVLLRYSLIQANNAKENATLGWRYSFLLRAFK